MPSSLFAPTLETSRLRLRPLQVQDADALLAIFSDPEVMKYWNTAPWTIAATRWILSLPPNKA